MVVGAACPQRHACATDALSAVGTNRTSKTVWRSDTTVQCLSIQLRVITTSHLQILPVRQPARLYMYVYFAPLRCKVSADPFSKASLEPRRCNTGTPPGGSTCLVGQSRCLLPPSCILWVPDTTTASQVRCDLTSSCIRYVPCHPAHLLGTRQGHFAPQQGSGYGITREAGGGGTCLSTQSAHLF